MPTANAMPASEMTLSVRPNASSTRNVPMTEIGIASATMPVMTNERRKMSSTIAAIAPPSQRFETTRSIDESM